MACRIVLFLLDSDSEAARTEADLNSPRIAEARSNSLGSCGLTQIHYNFRGRLSMILYTVAATNVLSELKLIHDLLP